jgi:hypothetical protein
MLWSPVGLINNRKENVMPKEKRNNLAIYTLAGSILLSSVLVSMNQSSAHTTDSKKIKALQTELTELDNWITEWTNNMGEKIDGMWQTRDRAPSGSGSSTSTSETARINALISCVNRAFDQMPLTFPKPQKC